MSVEIQTDGAGTGVTAGVKLVSTPICPDLLEHRDLGAADCLRGRAIRGFFLAPSLVAAAVMSES